MDLPKTLRKKNPSKNHGEKIEDKTPNTSWKTISPGLCGLTEGTLAALRTGPCPQRYPRRLASAPAVEMVKAAKFWNQISVFHSSHFLICLNNLPEKKKKKTTPKVRIKIWGGVSLFFVHQNRNLALETTRERPPLREARK